MNSSLTRWFGLMLTADPQRFLNWLKQDKTNLLEFYLYHNIEIRIREHDQDPSDFGEDFETFDDVYYFRIPPGIFPTSGEIENEEFHKTLVRSLLQGLAGLDHNAYQHILLESLTLLPAESEEEAYRWRNVRLAEKGFLPFDDAIGIYQPISPEDLIKAAKTIKKTQFEMEPHVSAP